MQNSFHIKLQELLEEYAHTAYKISRTFPREELFGLTSQLRRSALSVLLNYTEGYARLRPGSLKYFVEIALGSLQESRILITFAHKENYMTSEMHFNLQLKADELGKMLYGIHRRLKS